MRVLYHTLATAIVLSLGVALPTHNSELTNAINKKYFMNFLSPNNFSPPNLLDLPDFPHIYKRGAKTITNATQEATNLSERYLKRLKAYISEDGFDHVRFEPQARTLHMQIVDIEDWAKDLMAENRQLKQQIQFAKRLFVVMMQASQTLRYFDKEKVDQQLVCKLTHLNLILLTLHNSQGYPDRQIKHYVATVSRFRKSVTKWGKIFESLSTVPMTVRIMFENQFIRAERTLEYLAS